VQDRNGNPKLLHGTLYFDGDANLFDQLLASKGLLLPASPLRIREESARIETFPAMVDHRVNGGPIRFGLPKGNAAANVNLAGFSDHFPVSVVIDEA
jgi:hypothetical protein